MFIVIEGVDAVGKTTVYEELLRKLVEEEKRAVLPLTFPRYDTKLGETILRWLKNGDNLKHPSAFQALMTADKLDAGPMIEEAMQQGKVVLCCRYWQSAFAYGAASGVSREDLWSLHESLPMPTHNILLDMPVPDALARRPDKRDAYEENPTFLHKVREVYRSIWRDPPRSEVNKLWSAIDASGTREQVMAGIWTELFSAPM